MILSIIVPVYNVEAYLKKCVCSLLDQDIPVSEYEIILVDDGSTDSSGQFCEDMAAVYENVRVIHQQNGGLSAARNTGIRAAKGEYVQFVDSDDYLNANIFRNIVGRLVEDDLDVLRINYQNVNSAGVVFEPNKYTDPYIDFSEDVCDGLSFLNERLGFACYAVQFIVRTSLLKQEGNGFQEGIYFEDVEWTPRILLQAKRVSSSKEKVYNYLYRADSIARNTDLTKKDKAIRDRFGILEKLNVLNNRTGRNPWFNGMIAHMSLSILNDICVFFYDCRKEYLDVLKSIKVFPLSTYHATQSAKRKIALANLSPSLYCRFLHSKLK